jgi:tRNA-Thr(GGU) m(6)t(6)A37 methyltransferase TsaA
MARITYDTIGVIRSPFKDIEGMPIQPRAAEGITGSVELNPELAPGLKDLEGFSHIILIYHFHLSQGFSLELRPFLDDKSRGVFATRAPRRPNPIGLSVVRLLATEGTSLSIQDVDVVDGTPLLDIKPFVPEFDNREVERIGWLHTKVRRLNPTKCDKRFSPDSEE